MRQSKSVIFNEYQRGGARRRGIAPDGKGQGNVSLSRATALGNSVRSSARIATRRNFRLSTSARRSPTEKSHSSEANTNARSQIADAHESAICHGISAPRHIAPCWLQLHLSYLTGALFELLNGRVRGKIFVRRFPQAQKFCASMPICSDVRGNST